MTVHLIIILSLSLILGVTITSFVIYIQSTQKEVKRVKIACKMVGEDVYNISSRLTPGNVSHSKANIQNMSQLLIKLGE